jgi:nucleoside-diphosphate-sugar epimerase
VYLVTGASGFIGRSLCTYLARHGQAHRAAVRESAGPGQIGIGGIDGRTDWASALRDIDVIIHLAGLAHVRDAGPSVGADMMSINRDGTRRLAEQAAAAGVRRLVYVSSIKVNGESTGGRAGPECFRSSDVPSPVGAYAASKWAAEQALHRVGGEAGLEYVIVRPPLVYGPGVGANFLRLAKLIRRGLPLPFAGVENRRSFVYVDNLVSLLVTCAEHERAAGETFLVSDGEDLSTRQLVLRIAEATGTRARLVPCPPALLRAAASLLGRREDMEKLTGSLAVDIGHTREALGWRPLVTVDEGLRRTLSVPET